MVQRWDVWRVPGRRWLRPRIERLRCREGHGVHEREPDVYRSRHFAAERFRMHDVERCHRRMRLGHLRSVHSERCVRYDESVHDRNAIMWNDGAMRPEERCGRYGLRRRLDLRKRGLHDRVRFDDLRGVLRIGDGVHTVRDGVEHLVRSDWECVWSLRERAPVLFDRCLWLPLERNCLLLRLRGRGGERRSELRRLQPLMPRRDV